MSRRIVGHRRVRVRERVQGDNEREQVEKWVCLLASVRWGMADGAPTVLPKQKSVFVVCVPLYSAEDKGGMVSDVPHAELELYGNQFRFRSSDRASRKFKHKESIVL